MNASRAATRRAAREELHGRPGPGAFRGTGELWDWKDRYLDWMVATGLSPVSVKGAHAGLTFFLRHVQARGVNRLADVSPEVMEQFAVSLRRLRNGLAPAPNSICSRLSVVKRFFRWLSKEGRVLYDPAEDLELPKVPSELPHVVLSEDEVFRLLNAPDLSTEVGYRDRAVLEMFFGTGLRPCELMRLKLDDVDYKHGIVQVLKGKGGKDRLIPAPGVTLAFVREYAEKVRPWFARHLKDDDGVLFLNHTGSHMAPSDLVWLFRRCRTAAGLDKHVTALTLRHCYGTMLLERGMSSRLIQEAMGHAKLGTTTIYMRLSLAGLKRHYNSAHPLERCARRRRCKGEPSDRK